MTVTDPGELKDQSQGEEHDGGRGKKSILGDGLEALIGAILELQKKIETEQLLGSQKV